MLQCDSSRNSMDTLYYSFLRKDLWPALIYLHINTLVLFPPLISDCWSELKSDCEHAFIGSIVTKNSLLWLIIVSMSRWYWLQHFPVWESEFCAHYKWASDIYHIYPIQFFNGALHRHVAWERINYQGHNDLYKSQKLRYQCMRLTVRLYCIIWRSERESICEWTMRVAP